MKNILTIAFMSFLAVGVNAQWTQKGADLDGEAANDFSGFSNGISSDGNTVAIGAFQNSGSFGWAGHVRVYNWNGFVWVQKGMDIDGEAAEDKSGMLSLSADGNTVAIGAPFNDGNGTSSGHVRIYNWDGSTWNQLGADIDGEVAGDFSGWSVSLSPDASTVAIGAPYNDNAGTDSGQVRVYTWNGSSWIQKGNDLNGTGGNSVALSSDGNILAIGSGKVYTWSGSSWLQQGANISGSSGGSTSLSIDGNTVAFGNINDSNAGVDAGTTIVYTWDGFSWVQKGINIDGESAGDRSGWAVSLSSDGDKIAIGAFSNGAGAGHARIYEWNGSLWSQLGSDLDGAATGDWYGRSVSLAANGNTISIGAPTNGYVTSDTGYVRVYELPSTADLPEKDLISLQIFPNPSSLGSINVKNYPNGSNYQIVNSLGQIVKQGKVESEINIEELNSGVYYFTTINESKSISKKLIIE